jgi:hypothetical protein
VTAQNLIDFALSHADVLIGSFLSITCFGIYGHLTAIVFSGLISKDTGEKTELESYQSESESFLRRIT